MDEIKQMRILVVDDNANIHKDFRPRLRFRPDDYYLD